MGTACDASEDAHVKPRPSEPQRNTHMSAHKDFVQANERYVASFGDKGNLPLPPAKKLLISALPRPIWPTREH